MAAEPAKFERSIEFDTAWQAWWEKYPMPETVPFGTVLRIDLPEMIGPAPLSSSSATKSLMSGIGRVLDEFLTATATRWSPVPGLIDIHYGPLGRPAAELKHSVVVGAVERCVREAVRDVSETVKREGAKIQRRVDWGQFEAACVKARVRADQIQILDVGEALFGTPEPDQPLSLRIWNAVDEILDWSLASGGYSTRYSRNRVLLFFPGYSKAMGDLKRKSIADEIAHAGRTLVERESEPEGEGPDTAKAAPAHAVPLATRAKPIVNTQAKPHIAPQPPPVLGARAKAAAEREEAERAMINQAYATLVANRAADMPDPSELLIPAGYDVHPVPMWWAKNRTVGGYVMEPVRKTADEWDRYFPSSSTELDPLDLPVLVHAVDRIQEQVASGKSSLVVVPVYWSTLDHPQQRTRYLGYCSKLPESARRLLVLEVAGMPEDLMSVRVDERIGQVRACCRAVMCRVRVGLRDFSQFKKLPIHAVGIDVGELPDYERGIIPAFDAFMDVVEPLKLRTYAHGLNTKSLLIAVQAAGVDFVAGRVIPDSEEAPLGIREFTISDLYDKPGLGEAAV